MKASFVVIDADALAELRGDVQIPLTSIRCGFVVQHDAEHHKNRKHATNPQRHDINMLYAVYGCLYNLLSTRQIEVVEFGL